MAEIGKTSAEGKRSGRGTAAKKGKTTRKKKVKGNGSDLLRTAAERCLAESSAELAALLMTKAMEGKFESVKLLIKMAEEEKGKKSERIREEEPSLQDMLIGSKVKIGQVWDGLRWKRLPKKKILEATVVEEVEEPVAESERDLKEKAPRQWNIDEDLRRQRPGR
jgi:hypothetical protein